MESVRRARWHATTVADSVRMTAVALVTSAVFFAVIVAFGCALRGLIAVLCRFALLRCHQEKRREHDE